MRISLLVNNIKCDMRDKNSKKLINDISENIDRLINCIKTEQKIKTVSNTKLTLDEIFNGTDNSSHYNTIQNIKETIYEQILSDLKLISSIKLWDDTIVYDHIYGLNIEITDIKLKDNYRCIVNFINSNKYNQYLIYYKNIKNILKFIRSIT